MFYWLEKFKNLPVGPKINSGVGVLVTLILTLCGLAIFIFIGIMLGFKSYRYTALGTNEYSTIQTDMLAARFAVNKFVRSGLEKYKDDFEQRMKLLDEDYEHLRLHEVSNKKRIDQLAELNQLRYQYKDSFSEVVSLHYQQTSLVEERLNQIGPSLKSKLDQVERISYDKKETETLHLSALINERFILGRLNIFKFLNSGEQQFIDSANSSFDSVRGSMELLRSRVEGSRKGLIEKSLQEFLEYRKAFKELAHIVVQKNDIVAQRLDVLGPEIASRLEGFKVANKKTQDQIGPVLSNMFYVLIPLMFLAAMIAYILGRFIKAELVASSTDLNSKISESLKGLTSSMSAIREAAGKLTQNSDTSNDVVSRQQSMLQETAAATTESAKNGESTKEIVESSLGIAESVRGLSNEGKRTVEQLVVSMDKISESNEEVHMVSDTMKKIAEKIKLIDDIVFQTKLLSFNASVEAARAGAHGKGFAVVAEEIGNLAKVSGDSAIEISKLLEDSLKEVDRVVNQNTERVEDGKGLVSVSSQLLGKIDHEVNSLNNSSNKVRTASEELMVAIGQISDAMNEIESGSLEVSQSATSGEKVTKDLIEQIENLKSIIDELEELTGESHSESRLISTQQEGQMTENFEVIAKAS